MWNKYVKKITNKFTHLKKAIIENQIKLPNTRDLLNYTANFPADYGGMGEILEERNYENLNFFDQKLSKIKTTPVIEIKQGSVYVPLECRNEILNINFNPTTNVNNFSSINTNIIHGAGNSVPFQNYPFQNTQTSFGQLVPGFYHPSFYRSSGMEYPNFLQRHVIPTDDNQPNFTKYFTIKLFLI